MFQARNFEIFPINSMEKIRGNFRPQMFENENTALIDERFSFQVAFRSIGKTLTDLTYSIKGCDKDSVNVFFVQSVPCTYPVAENSDDYVLESSACMMPDILAPITASGIVARSGIWQSFYIVLSGLSAGKYTLQFSVSTAKGEVLGEIEYTLTVLEKKLPESDLVCTFWMHYDSLADYYGLPLFSEEYNRVLQSFLCSAVQHGLTMLLTPLFTPPLDTEIGKERMTVQLVDIKKEEGKYQFNFERLDRFMKFAEKCGVKYFEMPHLFTQWGAGFAPKIMAMEDGKEKRIFGWENAALSREYKEFLSVFLPCLRTWLLEKNYYSRCYFHISDEPNAAAFEHYKECLLYVRHFLPDAKFTDALSHYEYYEQGLTDYPFIALDATEEFIEKNAKNYFVYYCMAQRNKFVSNRFLSMPLERTRILGTQMYLNDVHGFLQWGYNFYYSFLSREAIDPFSVTDCMGKFQSGDAFVVYPGKDGALESMRGEAFYQGMQDLRALKLLEKKIGREQVCRLLEKNGISRNFNDYPKNALWLVSLRKTINDLLRE